jgi:hypothetical protein
LSGPLPGLQKGFSDMSDPQPEHVWPLSLNLG